MKKRFLIIMVVLCGYFCGCHTSSGGNQVEIGERTADPDQNTVDTEEQMVDPDQNTVDTEERIVGIEENEGL